MAKTSNQNWFAVCMYLLAVSMVSAEWSYGSEKIDITRFTGEISDNGFPVDWQEFTFPSISQKTHYSIVADTTYGPVLWARSSAGAGGVGRRILEDPKQYPILTWSWKIDSIIKNGSLSRKDGDDFPARLLVSFSGPIPDVPFKEKTLCYVWAAHEPIGTIGINPFHKNIATIVAVSGSDKIGKWQELSRDIVADYYQAFSENPGHISAISLMTDSDNTKTQVEAWYGPVYLQKDNGSAP